MLYWPYRLCVSQRWTTKFVAIHIDNLCACRIGFIKTDNFHVWQSFFWICGAMTFAYGIVVGIFLPDNPVKAKFINEREKAIAIDRVRVNQTGKPTPSLDWSLALTVIPRHRE